MQHTTTHTVLVIPLLVDSMINTSLHSHKSFPQGTTDLWDISVTSRITQNTYIDALSRTCTTNPLNTKTRSLTFAEIVCFIAIKQFWNDFCLGMLLVTYDLLQGHPRFPIPHLSEITQIRAMSATAGRAACIYLFLCSRLTAAGTGKVVQQ